MAQWQYSMLSTELDCNVDFDEELPEDPSGLRHERMGTGTGARTKERCQLPLRL
jgi:hypothetical protein